MRERLLLTRLLLVHHYESAHLQETATLNITYKTSYTFSYTESSISPPTL